MDLSFILGYYKMRFKYESKISNILTFMTQVKKIQRKKGLQNLGYKRNL